MEANTNFTTKAIVCPFATNGLSDRMACLEGSLMKTLITCVAGFIGTKTADVLLKADHDVTGIDDLNDYYDPDLKKDRLKHFTEKQIPTICASQY